MLKELTQKELLAYETGVHLGDGCLYISKGHGTYRTEFSGNSETDKEFYSKILPKILKKLYKKSPKLYKKKNENTIVVVLNSKEIAEQKIRLGIPVGDKLNLKEIPDWIKDNLIPHFIRGLADTDFSVTFKKNRKGIHCEPRIELFTNNEIIAEFLYESLKKLNFKPTLERTFRRGFREFRLRLYGKAMLNDWLEKIGFFNPKHLNKIHVFKKFGYVN